jgi:hypothetical protein
VEPVHVPGADGIPKTFDLEEGEFMVLERWFGFFEQRLAFLKGFFAWIMPPPPRASAG